MCRTQISVDYDGQLYDCDFNLAAGIPVVGNQKIFDVTGKPYQVRKIRMDSIVMHARREPVPAEAAQRVRQAA